MGAIEVTMSLMKPMAAVSGGADDARRKQETRGAMRRGDGKRRRGSRRGTVHTRRRSGRKLRLFIWRTSPSKRSRGVPIAC
jgi:hypothetical protein